MDNEKEIRIIGQGSEEARLVSKAMASATASRLLDALSERPKTATDLEAETGYPLPTIQYHLGNLLDAGLVTVTRIRYSEKGKPMKVYAAADTLIVISPKTKKEDEVRPVLRRYGFTAAGLVVAVSAAAAVCSSVLGGHAAPQAMKLAAVPDAVVASKEAPFMVSVTETAAGFVDAAADIPFSQVNLGLLIFLIAALLILAGLMVFEIVRIRKAESGTSRR